MSGRFFVLLSILVIGAVYVYFGNFVVPLQAEARLLREDLQKLETSSRYDALELTKLRGLEQKEKDDVPLQLLSEKLRQTVPSTPLVSVPSRFAQLFDAREIPNSRSALRMVLPFNGVPMYIVGGWNVRANGVNPLRLAEALSDLENEFPLGQVTSLRLENSTATGTVDFDLTVQLIALP
jgi:hypothetical protein